LAWYHASFCLHFLENHYGYSLVTNNLDNGEGSLRTVIKNARAGDIIRFSSSLASQTIRLTSGGITLIKISQSMALASQI
jgi:hypothetical protein